MIFIVSCTGYIDTCSILDACNQYYTGQTNDIETAENLDICNQKFKNLGTECKIYFNDVARCLSATNCSVNICAQIGTERIFKKCQL